MGSHSYIFLSGTAPQYVTCSEPHNKPALTADCAAAAVMNQLRAVEHAGVCVVPCITRLLRVFYSLARTPVTICGAASWVMRILWCCYPGRHWPGPSACAARLDQKPCVLASRYMEGVAAGGLGYRSRSLNSGKQLWSLVLLEVMALSTINTAIHVHAACMSVRDTGHKGVRSRPTHLRQRVCLSLRVYSTCGCCERNLVYCMQQSSDAEPTAVIMSESNTAT